MVCRDVDGDHLGLVHPGCAVRLAHSSGLSERIRRVGLALVEPVAELDCRVCFELLTAPPNLAMLDPVAHV